MSTNDLSDSKLEEMLTMLESLQAELEEKQKANFEALTNISKLSSENSTLRNELQKKSDKIVALNAKMKEQSQIEADLAKSEEAKKAGEKAERAAEALKAILEGREAELDEREAEIKRKEGDLVTEIETEATKRIFDVRYKLNEEYKRNCASPGFPPIS